MYHFSDSKTALEITNTSRTIDQRGVMQTESDDDRAYWLDATGYGLWRQYRRYNLPLLFFCFQARLEKISASYRIERKSGFQVVKKTKPADFSIGGTGSIDFGYIDYSDYSKSAVKSSGTYDPFKIYRAGVSLIDGRVDTGRYDKIPYDTALTYFYPPLTNVTRSLDSGLTVSEVLSILSTGQLEKDFGVSSIESIPSLELTDRQEGTITLHVSTKPQHALIVKPNTPFKFSVFGKGDTTRKVTLEMVEEQRWVARLSGTHDLQFNRSSR